MIRRTALVVGALVAAFTLSSCSTFTANDDVASVGGVSLDRDTFEVYMRDILEISNAGADNSLMSGDLARRALSQWVVEELTRQFLDQQGVPVTDADRTAAASEVDQQLAAYEEAVVTPGTKAFLVESVAAQMAFQNSQQPGSLQPFEATVDIEVDSRYGYWDSATGSVVGFG